MIETEPAHGRSRSYTGTDINPLRPSEYTGLLIHALEQLSPGRVHGTILEIGVGSGVVLATLARLGASRLVGVDIEPSAIRATADLLARLGYTAELLQGDLWAPVAGRRFNLIVANLPSLACVSPCYPGRLPSWSFGGVDGRLVLDRWLCGLRDHLADDGRAIIVHSTFVGLRTTADLLRAHGLTIRKIGASLMPLAPEKHRVMTPALLEDPEPHAIRLIGPHIFLATEILEIEIADSVKEH